MPLGTNERMLLEVATKMPASLLPRVVFLGGSVVSLLLSDKASAGARTTQDVDLVINVSGRTEFDRAEQQLQAAGFKRVFDEDAPICRWKIASTLVDFMPSDETILGFSNRWYRDALSNSIPMSLEHITIRIASGPYFLATKTEAFLGRGNNDFPGSPDLEDIITILDGRPEIVSEIQAAGKDLQTYLRNIFRGWFQNKRFREALPGHLSPDSAGQERLPLLIERIQSIAGLPAS